MKKCLLMMAIGAIVALTSCHEQSQLDFGAVTGTATVQGYVYINKGYIQDGANYVVKSLPATDCEVLVKVPYKKYDPQAADGDKFFEGVCDANGFYSIEVPVGQAAITGVKVYTRPLVDKYYDLVNDAIVETDASYPEASATVDIERGKVYTAANIYLTKDVQSPILTRSQVVTLKGSVKEVYEKKVYADPDNTDKGHWGEADTRSATQQVELVVTFTNADYSAEKIVYNITTDIEGDYNLSANLYDMWDVAKTTVKVEAKAYLVEEFTHYYDKWNKEESKFESTSQKIAGYYNSGNATQTLKEGDLLIGTKMKDIVLTFVPDYANYKIFGIENYDIDYVDGQWTYKSKNPLGWAY